MRVHTASLSLVALLSAFTAIAGVQSCATRAQRESSRGESAESEQDGDEDEVEEDEEADEETIDLKQAPQAVRDAATRIVGSAKLVGVSKETDDGVTTFEVEYLVDGNECSATLSEGGEVLELERRIPNAKLPAALMRALNAKYPGAKVGKAEKVEVHYFELELEIDGKLRKVSASASGEFGEGDED